MDEDIIITEYLKSIQISEDLLKLAKTNPDTILEEYIVKYLKFKLDQEEKSSSQALPVHPTKISNKVNFSDLEDFDKWIMTPEYKIYLTNIISKLRTIGYLLGDDCVKSLTSTISINKCNIYKFDFFTKNSVQPNFLTFQRILYTFGFGHQIFSYEFKKFFTCGHRLIGLISLNNNITLTWNVDTINEFFKKLIRLEQACVKSGIKYLFDEFKILFGKFKNYVLGLIIKLAINNWHMCKYKINLCLQECDEDLYLYLKDQLQDIFIGYNFSPQNSKIFQIDNFIDFAFDPQLEKIKLEPTNSTHGFATFTNISNTLTPIKVFNSLVLSHEKKSIKRGFTYTNRGIYIPEINLYNLHLKSNYAYTNLVSLEKIYFENDLTEYNSIYSLNYSFTSGSYTQIYGVVALANKYPNLTIQQIHNIIDIIYDRKLSFDQVLLDLLKVIPTKSNIEINIFTNVKSELKEKYSSLFEDVKWEKFSQAVNIHWTKSFERLICKKLMSQAIQDFNLINPINPINQVNQVNPDIVIKEFCSTQNNHTFNLELNSPNLSNLVICGDVNIILIDLDRTRIKKYSYKSKPTEDEPFNHFLKMQMNSCGNDVIFSLCN